MTIHTSTTLTRMFNQFCCYAPTAPRPATSEPSAPREYSSNRTMHTLPNQQHVLHVDFWDTCIHSVKIFPTNNTSPKQSTKQKPHQHSIMAVILAPLAESPNNIGYNIISLQPRNNCPNNCNCNNTNAKNMHTWP